MDNFTQLLSANIVEPVKHKFSEVETKVDQLKKDIASLSEKEAKQTNFIANLAKKISEIENNIHNLKNELMAEKVKHKTLLDAINKLNWE